MRSRHSKATLLAVAALWSSALGAHAQPAPPRAAAELDDTQRAQLSALVLANPEVRRVLRGEAQPRVHYGAPVYDKAEVEAYLQSQTDQAPSPRVTVLVRGRAAAASAEVSLRDRRVMAVRPVAAEDIPLFDEDVAEAFALVRENGPIRETLGARLQQFQPAEAGREYPTSAYVAQALPTRSSDPQDACSRDRCLEFLFRTPEGYLPFRVQVDLTRRSVMPITPSEGHHP